MRGALVSVGEPLLEVALEAGAASALLGAGGDAANVVAMAAREGADARLVARVGDDAAGRLLVDAWRAAGVDLRALLVDPEAATGLYTSERRPDGHRFDYHRACSAGSRLAPEDIRADVLAGAGVVLGSGIGLAVSTSLAAAVRAAWAVGRAAGARVAFAVNHRAALAPDPDVLLAAARDADVVLVSLDDARALGLDGPPEAVARALGRPDAEVVVTAGADGATALAPGLRVTARAPVVPVVDAGGAGDALAGGYLAARLAGADPAAALARGVAAGAASVGRRGCASAYPSRAEVDALVREVHVERAAS